MGVLAAIFGTIGGLCAVMGVITAVAVIPDYGGLGWLFWFVLSAILFLVTLIFTIGRGAGYE